MCLYQWRAHRNSVAKSLSAKSYAVKAGLRAVKDALKRRGRSAQVSYIETPRCGYRISYELTGSALVSIIIPNKDAYVVLKSCVDSIYSKSSYKNFEIIVVDNGSRDKRCFDFYNSLTSRYKNFSWISFKGSFNFAHLNCLGVEKAKGEHLVFK